MQIGELRHRITIQKFSSVISENGFEEEEWLDYKTVWCKMQNLQGREYWSAKAVQSENTVRFTIRYLKDLDTKNYRIVFDSKIYNINSIDDMLYRHNYIEIKGSEVI